MSFHHSNFEGCAFLVNKVDCEVVLAVVDRACFCSDCFTSSEKSRFWKGIAVDEGTSTYVNDGQSVDVVSKLAW